MYQLERNEAIAFPAYDEFSKHVWARNVSEDR